MGRLAPLLLVFCSCVFHDLPEYDASAEKALLVSRVLISSTCSGNLSKSRVFLVTSDWFSDYCAVPSDKYASCLIGGGPKDLPGSLRRKTFIYVSEDHPQYSAIFRSHAILHELLHAWLKCEGADRWGDVDHTFGWVWGGLQDQLFNDWDKSS